MSKVAIAVTTFNNPVHIKKLLNSCKNQTMQDYEVFIADDGSSDNTVEIMEEYAQKNTKIHVFPLEHGERGIARLVAIGEALKSGPKYLLIIDSDMFMKKNLLLEAVKNLERNTDVEALIVKELPYTDYTNYYSRVKVFERQLINNSGENVDLNSIEAARFWRSEAYVATGGIHPEQIAFEEIQPTIKCMEKGGIIKKLMVSGIYHDEKEVTLSNILQKKKYYFKMMNKTIDTEEKGLLKALTRWYLFRPVYYRKKNLKLYMQHPMLTFGVVFMYVALTFIGAYEVLIHKIKRDGSF